MWMRLLLTVLIGYFLGNLNGAFLMYKLFAHEDIRKSGSGNAGLTNFMRQFGPSKGIWVLLIDIGKAVVACLLGKLLLAPSNMAMEGVMVGALAVSLGHDFPALMGFRGGKGIVCGFSVALCADWRCALIILAVFVISLAVTRYVSLSSMTMAVALVIFYALFGHWQLLPLGTVLAVMIIWAHRSNIGRLMRGEESKFVLKK